MECQPKTYYSGLGMHPNVTLKNPIKITIHIVNKNLFFTKK